MRAKVTAEGLLIPRELLGEADEVEIRKEDGQIVILAVSAEDPIFGLGQDPVECSTPDASERHDAYLYGPGS